MFSLQDVLEVINDREHRIIGNWNSEIEFWEFRYVNSKRRIFNKNCLYLIEGSILKDVTIGTGLLSIVFLEEEQDIIDQIQEGNCYILLNKSHFSVIFARFTKALSYQSKMWHGLYKLQNMVNQNAGLPEMAEKMEEILEMPVCIIDTAFRFIVKSGGFLMQSGPDSDNEGLSEEMLGQLRQDGDLQIIEDSDSMIRTSYLGRTVYFIPVFVGTTKVAYLNVFENAGNQSGYLRNAYMRFLPMLAQTVGMELSKNDFYKYNKAACYNYLLTMLLDNNTMDVQDMRMRLSLFDYELKEQIYLFVVDLEGTRMHISARNQLCEEISERLKNSIYLNRENCILFLVSRDDSSKISSGELASMEQLLKSEQLYAGFDGPMTELREISERMSRALSIVRDRKNKESSHNIFRFEDYQVEAMLNMVSRHQELDAFIYRPVQKLLDYDREHGTVLMDTLQEYYRNPHDIKTVCEKLCIHRNTFYKRMDKISEVTGCDVTVADEILKIQLSIRIIEQKKQR